MGPAWGRGGRKRKVHERLSGSALRWRRRSLLSFVSALEHTPPWPLAHTQAGKNTHVNVYVHIYADVCVCVLCLYL